MKGQQLLNAAQLAQLRAAAQAKMAQAERVRRAAERTRQGSKGAHRD